MKGDILMQIQEKINKYLNEGKLSRQSIREIAQTIGEDAANDLFKWDIISSKKEREAASFIADRAKEELEKISWR